MSITINVSSDAAASLDQFDSTSLSNLSLQYQPNLDRFSINSSPTTLTQLSSSLIAFSSGNFSFTLAGSGIGPVSSQQALMDAINTGVATGAFNSMTLQEGATTILSMAFSASGTTLSSGDVSLTLAGNVPNSFEDIFALQGLLQDMSLLSDQERSALFDSLSSFNASGITLTQAGTELLRIDLASTAASLTIDGFTLSFEGTIPQDLGAVAEVMYQWLEASQNMMSPSPLRDPDIAIYNSAGEPMTYAYWPYVDLDQTGLAAGQYFAEVLGYQGSFGSYRLSLERQQGAPLASPINLIEGADAAAGTNTTYDIGSGGSFTGALSGGPDTTDWIAFDYVPGQSLFLSADPVFFPVDLSSVTGLVLNQVTLTVPGGAEFLRITSDGNLLADALNPNGQGQVLIDGQRYDNIIISPNGTGSSSDDALRADFAGSTFMTGLGGNDSLYSYDGRDHLDGGEGDDLLESVDGNSTLMGGAGNDRLVSNAGVDWLYGDDGTDTLIGGGGDDFLFGGSSVADLRDVIYGGDGNDSIEGGYGNDELRGDAGNDTVAGGFGADTVIGGAGDDVLTGSAYGDVIFGSDGNDFINGGFGFDRVNGGAGADKFYHLGIRDHGSDWIQDYNAADGDVLMFGGPNTTLASDFLIQRATTATAGADGVQEIFVTQRSTGNLLWALVDGDGQAEINIQIGTQVFDLLA